MTHISMWKEQDLFNWLKEFTPDLVQMDDPMSRWDCISDDLEFVIELKCRRTHYPTMLIEKKKYDALIKKAKQHGYQAVYINSTPNGVYAWVLDEVDIEWKVETKHPATTSFGNRNRVPKEVGYLDINDSKVMR